MKIRNEKGIALILTLMILVVLVGFSAVFVLRTIHDYKMTKIDTSQNKAFYLSEAANHNALNQIETLINTYMYNTINNTVPTTVITLTNNYFNAGNSIGFLVSSVKNAGVAVLTENGGQAEYSIEPVTVGSGAYEYRMVFTEKAEPTKPSVDEWRFHYNYKIEAIGESNGMARELVLNGDFSVSVQRDNFAKYALFTNNQQMPNGTNVWFTSRTNFTGPLFTNGRYNFYGNPGGTFYGSVGQVEQTARFYNNGSAVLLNGNQNGSIDVPVFNAGFNRSSSPVTLSSAVQKQDLIDQATGGNTYSTNGIYVPNNGTALIGGIYVRGNASVDMAVVSNNARYTIQQGTSTVYVTVDQATNQTTVQDGANPAVVYNGIPDGIDNAGTIIFVNGNISSFQGTVQRDTQLTVSSENDIVIQNHVIYEDFTPAVGAPGDANYVPPSAEGFDNMLGIVSWDGNVRIGTSAPNDINVFGTVLSSSGIFAVDDYENAVRGPRGIATVLGGVISNQYGAFGQFNGTTGAQISGYGRNFTYDQRMQMGNAPPYFPTLNTFIAYTADITDKLVWQERGN